MYFQFFTEVPADFVLHLEDTKGKENQDVTFTCKTNEDEIPVTWLVDGKPLTPSDKYIVQSDGFTHTLTIKNLSPIDTCEVTAIIGDNSSSAKLSVEGSVIIKICH